MSVTPARQLNDTMFCLPSWQVHPQLLTWWCLAHSKFSVCFCRFIIKELYHTPTKKQPNNPTMPPHCRTTFHLLSQLFQAPYHAHAAYIFKTGSSNLFPSSMSKFLSNTEEWPGCYQSSVIRWPPWLATLSPWQWSSTFHCAPLPCTYRLYGDCHIVL